jgi:aminobenzoyl-glutamate utilization protein B
MLHTPEKLFALDFAERNVQAIAGLSDSLFYFGELGLQEYRSAELMCALLEEHGFEVQRGICGFPTAFMATFGRGAPVIAIHSEYDANTANSQRSGVTQQSEIVAGAPGHCEGHNVNGAVLTVAAIGLRYVMQRFKLPGTLKIFGAPAEEQLLSRPYFVRDGLFDDVDIAFHDHILGEFKADYGVGQNAAISAIARRDGATRVSRRATVGLLTVRRAAVALRGQIVRVAGCGALRVQFEVLCRLPFGPQAPCSSNQQDGG